MPFFYDFDKAAGPIDAGRTAKNLLELRRKLNLEIPRRTVVDSLLLATWNI
ncbi:MAG: hypothetical protein O3B08_00665 [Proteobacteria bacterium]|nr:hypothetical protein [Pseudomonadota bacterium]